MGWQRQKEEVVRAAGKLLERGLVTATSGNVSVRLPTKDGRLPTNDDGQLFAITPSGVPYEDMKTEDIIVIDSDVDVIEGEGVPSSESLTHVAVYEARSDVRCVIHTHSLYASVLAVAAVDLPPIIDEMVVYLGGPVKVAEYGFPSTEELGEKTVAALEDRNAVLIRNHGVVSTGTGVFEAMRASELVERAAHIFVEARAFGRVQELPAPAVEAERQIFKMQQHIAQE